MAFVFYLVKRALTKAFGGDMFGQASSGGGAAPDSSSSSATSYPTRDIVDTVWEGMRAEQLEKSFGLPKSKMTSGTQEIWTYANLNGQGTETSITLENGIVVFWQDAAVPQRAIS